MKRKVELEGRYGRYKSRKRYKQVFVKVPGGRTVVQYKEKEPKPAKCALCKVILKGVASKRPAKMQNIAKSRKKVSRKYGGYLCSKCSRKKIIEDAR